MLTRLLFVVVFLVGCLWVNQTHAAYCNPSTGIDKNTKQVLVAANKKKPAATRHTNPPARKTNPPPGKKDPKGDTGTEPAASAEPAAAPSGGGGTMLSGGSTRIEFDGMNIKGQTTKAGEVQILERKDTELKSMVKRRTSFRDEIIQTVFPEK
jgi:hypothetical protein